MTDLKRKRSSGDHDQDSTQTACSAETPYFEGMPDGLADLADVKLLVQDHVFPVHSYILRESPSLVAAVSAARNDNQRVCQVPLPGESKQHVMLVLKYVYSNPATIHSESVLDAQALTIFAHKYNMTRLHKLSEAYLVEKLSFTNTNVFGWAELAERIELNLLLAHCEQSIILNFHSMSASEKKVSSVSQASLLRIMDGLAGRGMVGCDYALAAQLSRCEYCQGLRLNEKDEPCCI